MTCEHLVCASCAHPVAEGRCGVCRAARSTLHAERVSSYASALVVATLLLAVAVLAVLGSRLS